MKLPRVIEVQATPDFLLNVRFDDGVAGVVDCHQLVHGPRAGVFAALAEPGRFLQAGVRFGAVSWPDELDLDPDTMHDALAREPRWVLN
jgi:Protein of unknown function (DUF2442)